MATLCPNVYVYYACGSETQVCSYGAHAYVSNHVHVHMLKLFDCRVFPTGTVG